MNHLLHRTAPESVRRKARMDRLTMELAMDRTH